jgi:hypothetical protein
MKTLTLTALAMLSVTAPAMAQNCTQNRIGQFTYTNCTDSNGNSWNGTSNQIGPFTYHNFTGPQGQQQTCTQNRIGQFVYTNCN